MFDRWSTCPLVLPRASRVALPGFALLSILALACSSDLKISSIQPATGSARGGQKITINGKGFDSDAKVTFGTTGARAVNRVSSDQLEVTTPLVIAGPVNVEVASGGDKKVSTNGFTFLPLELRFVEAPSHYLPSLAAADAVDAASADFNRDGHPDLFLAIRNATSRVLLNSGSGSFVGTATPPDAGTPEAGAPEGGAPDGSTAEAGGVDASPAEGGAPDASTADAASPPATTEVIHDVRKAVVQDFDRDGNTDVFLCNGSGEPGRLLLGDGKGKLAAAADGAVPAASDECISAVAADFNKDGRSDLIVLGRGPAGSGKSYVRVLLNRAEGTSVQFAPAAELEPAADVQGKDCGNVSASAPEITGTFVFDKERSFAGSFSGKASYDFAGAQGTIAFGVTPPAVQRVPTAVEFDLFGDKSGHGLKLQVVDAKQELFEVDLGALSWSGWRHVKAEKLEVWSHSGTDSDGVVDLPLASVSVQLDGKGSLGKSEIAFDGIVLAIPGAGLAVAEDFERIAFAAAWPGVMSSVAAGDLDGDGLVDILAGSTDAATGVFAALALNKTAAGAAKLQVPGGGAVPPLPDPISSLALMDADGDGDVDIVAISGVGQDRLLLNDGSGHFFDDTLVRMPLDHSAGSSVAVSDMDLDGRADLIVANTGTVNRLYLNHGVQGFVDSTPALPLHPWHSRVVVPFDADDDGDIDLFVLNSGGEASKLYVSVEPVAKH
jgi:hypothetical protein